MAGTSSCQPIYDIGGGQAFVLQNVDSGEYLSAVSTNPLQQIASSPTDPRLWFTYDTTKLQIKSLYNDLCIEDLDHGYSSSSSTSDTLAFTGCDYRIAQQFVYQPNNKWLLNPNNAYDKCLDGSPGYPGIYLWYCPDGGTNHQWTIILICPPGTVINYSIGIIVFITVRRKSHEHCG